ncbi:MAG TPA: TrkA C-terminal domain-containing protein, partial [Aggregatilineaceae bacterium]|nr:TrkA C-terminal domain-containing protein [Aggregatilineaceae bacterium]
MMARGTISIIGWLIVATVIMVLIVSVIAVLTGSTSGTDGESQSLLKTVWNSLMHALDSGALGGDGTDNIGFVVLMIVMTAFGIFVLSILIGILTTAIDAKIEDMRKGRSFVVEQGHTVILGWSPQIFSVISELVTASENQSYSCIVILAEKDKVEMEDAIRSRVGRTGHTRIVCRTGSPIDLTELEIVNPDGARSIIILSGEEQDPDAYVIKCLLALTNAPGRTHICPIVAEIRSADNLEVARMVGRDKAILLPVSDLISRIAVQTCLQSGLSVVYMELLDFGGDEIYFKEEPGLVGKTLGEALLAYETSSVIGLRLHDGQVKLNPPLDTVIQRGDQVIAISADDDTIVLSGKTDVGIRPEIIVAPNGRQKAPERTLILGWNQRGTAVICQLDFYVAPGSELTIVADMDDLETVIAQGCSGLQNLQVQVLRGNTTHRRTLDELSIPTYDHVITLSNDEQSIQEADAHTLVTLLHLRDISDKSGCKFSIVSEMLDVRNRELAEITRADDFIVSDKLISLMLSQVSENPELLAVLMDLFDPDGSELYLKPASDYVQLGEALPFYTVVQSARQRHEIAVGYRLVAEAGDVNRAYGVHVNPNKAQSVTFGPDDKIIVLAEE